MEPQLIKSLATRTLVEVVGDAFDRDVGGRRLLGYIGFAPTGQIHLGYLVPCAKIRDLTLAGCDVAVLIADRHALLDDRKTPRHLLDKRSEYYEKTLSKVLETLGTDMDRVRFVRGTSFQRTDAYDEDLWDLVSKTPIAVAKKAGTDVVKQRDNPTLGSLLYPLMQAVDERHVLRASGFGDKQEGREGPDGDANDGRSVDFELGGLDQRKIFMFSRDHVSKGSVTYLMTPIVSLSKAGKMSASDPNSKISFSDSNDAIGDKIKKAFCADGDADCGLLKLFESVLFPLLTDGSNPQLTAETREKASFVAHRLFKTDGRSLVIKRDDGEFAEYADYDAFEKDFVSGKVSPQQLKRLATELLCGLVGPVRRFLEEEDTVRLVKEAYPSS